MSAQSLHCLHQMPSLMTPNLGSGGSIEKSFLRTRQRKEGRVLFQRSIKIRMAKWTIPRADSKTLTLMRHAFSGMASCCHLNRILETQYGDCTANRNKTQTKQLSAKGGEMRHSKNYGGRKLLDATWGHERWRQKCGGICPQRWPKPRDAVVRKGEMTWRQQLFWSPPGPRRGPSVVSCRLQKLLTSTPKVYTVSLCQTTPEPHPRNPAGRSAWGSSRAGGTGRRCVPWRAPCTRTAPRSSGCRSRQTSPESPPGCSCSLREATPPSPWDTLADNKLSNSQKHPWDALQIEGAKTFTNCYVK